MSEKKQPKWQGHLTWLNYLNQGKYGGASSSMVYVTKHHPSAYQALAELQLYINNMGIGQERIRSFKIYSIPRSPWKWNYDLPKKV